MKRLKILFISSGSELAGAERCLFEIVSMIDKKKFEPYLIIPYEGLFSQELRNKGINHTIMNIGVIRSRKELKSFKIFIRLLQTLIASYKLSKLIIKENIDIVHSNTSAILAGALAAKFTKRCHVWHIREIIISPKIIWFVMRKLIPYLSTKVVCVSTPVMDHFKPYSKLISDKFLVIHDGTTLYNFAEKAKESEEKRVGMVARINPWKGHELFIKAAYLVLKKLPNVKFIIVGGCLDVYEPLKRKLLDLVKELKIDNNVIFTGYLPHKEVYKILQSFDVFVLPSTNPDPFPGTVLEAMAMGKPVVATKHGGVLDSVVDGETGILVPPNSPEKMAEAIEYLIKNPDLCKSFGEKGRKRVREMFLVKHNIEKMERLFSKIGGECEK